MFGASYKILAVSNYDKAAAYLGSHNGGGQGEAKGEANGGQGEAKGEANGRPKGGQGEVRREVMIPCSGATKKYDNKKVNPNKKVHPNKMLTQIRKVHPKRDHGHQQES